MSSTSPSRPFSGSKFTTGPKSAAMIDELRKYVISEPYPFVMDITKGYGNRIVTVDGQELIDWSGYYGSKLISHNHPGLFEPEYVKRLTFAANNKTANPDFLTPECLDYYRAIYYLAPESMRNDKLEVYCVNSGAEAVENMMKYLVSLFNSRKIAEGKTPTNRRFLYFDKAFHGRTVYALGVTQTMDPVATKDFHGLTSGGNLKLPFPSYNSDLSREENLRQVDRVLEMVDSALGLMQDEVVGMIVEPIQGAGGQRVALPEFFQGLSRLSHKHGIALAFDEVQTGLGVTGRNFAIDHFELPYPPLAIATGKKFGCGVVYMLEPLDDLGVLDSTWGGTLADMVRVTRELEIVAEEGLIERARITGDYLVTELKALQVRHPELIGNVRGMGLYQGFSMLQPEHKGRFISLCREEFGLLLLGAGSRSIRLRPTLSVTTEQVDELISLLDQALSMLD